MCLKRYQDRLGPPHQHAFGAATPSTATFAVSKELDENRFTLFAADSSRPIGSGRLNSETASCSLHPVVVSCSHNTFEDFVVLVVAPNIAFALSAGMANGYRHLLSTPPRPV